MSINNPTFNGGLLTFKNMKKKLHNVKPETYPSMSENKKIKVYPTFRLGDDDLPELKEMEVGKKYHIVMEVEVKSKAQGQEWGDTDDKQIRASFKVMKVGLKTDEKKAPTTAKSFEMEFASKKSGNTGSRYDK